MKNDRTPALIIIALLMLITLFVYLVHLDNELCKLKDRIEDVQNSIFPSVSEENAFIGEYYSITGYWNKFTDKDIKERAPTYGNPTMYKINDVWIPSERVFLYTNVYQPLRDKIKASIKKIESLSDVPQNHPGEWMFGSAND